VHLSVKQQEEQQYKEQLGAAAYLVAVHACQAIGKRIGSLEVSCSAQCGYQASYVCWWTGALAC
jgi:hypothetical protein